MCPSAEARWSPRPETAADGAAVHAPWAAAFPTESEAGLAGVRALRDAARLRGESRVLVPGRRESCPESGFAPAPRYGIRPGFEVSHEAMTALVLDGSAAVARGRTEYPAASGV
ncbi:hypothetical protein EAO72_10425 [Streptomyces sp. or43]|nr:hypothetical protein EAO72_10425 [Streptomyces sp. or43]